jgi:hypothetical protein
VNNVISRYLIIKRAFVLAAIVQTIAFRQRLS